MCVKMNWEYRVTCTQRTAFVTINAEKGRGKRVTPINMKSSLPSGPLKTKLIIINYNNHDKKPIYK